MGVKIQVSRFFRDLHLLLWQPLPPKQQRGLLRSRHPNWLLRSRHPSSCIHGPRACNTKVAASRTKLSSNCRSPPGNRRPETMLSRLSPPLPSDNRGPVCGNTIPFWRSTRCSSNRESRPGNRKEQWWRCCGPTMPWYLAVLLSTRGVHGGNTKPFSEQTIHLHYYLLRLLLLRQQAQTQCRNHSGRWWCWCPCEWSSQVAPVAEL